MVGATRRRRRRAAVVGEARSAFHAGPPSLDGWTGRRDDRIGAARVTVVLFLAPVVPVGVSPVTRANGSRRRRDSHVSAPDGRAKCTPARTAPSQARRKRQRRGSIPAWGNAPGTFIERPKAEGPDDAERWYGAGLQPSFLFSRNLGRCPRLESDRAVGPPVGRSPPSTWCLFTPILSEASCVGFRKTGALHVPRSNFRNSPPRTRRARSAEEISGNRSPAPCSPPLSMLSGSLRFFGSVQPCCTARTCGDRGGARGNYFAGSVAGFAEAGAGAALAAASAAFFSFTALV